MRKNKCSFDTNSLIKELECDNDSRSFKSYKDCNFIAAKGELIMVYNLKVCHVVLANSHFKNKNDVYQLFFEDDAGTLYECVTATKRYVDLAVTAHKDNLRLNFYGIVKKGKRYNKLRFGGRFTPATFELVQ